MKIELEVSEEDMAQILAYEFAREDMPTPGEFSEPDVRRVVEQHFYGISDSRAPYWGEGLSPEKYEAFEKWAKDTAQRFK